MKVPVFVVGSSLFLAAWLGITYVRTAPVSTYIEIPVEEQVIKTERPSFSPLVSVQ